MHSYGMCVFSWLAHFAAGTTWEAVAMAGGYALGCLAMLR